LNYETFSRTYSGFAEIAANIGAILNIVFLIFNCIVFAYSRIHFFQRLIKNSIYMYYKNPSLMNDHNFSDKDIKKTEATKVLVEESKINLNNTQENQLKMPSTIPNLHKIELLNVNKKEGAETKNTLLTKLSKTNETQKKLDNFSFLKYQTDGGFFQMIILSLCPCFRFCMKRLDRDITILEFSKKHYHRYTDFFRFVDRSIELSILKKLILKKEESEVFDVLKRVVMVRNFGVLDLINPKYDDNNTYQTSHQKFTDKIKTKGSISAHEEKIKKYVNSILNKENKSTLEQNIVEHFDEIL